MLGFIGLTVLSEVATIGIINSIESGLVTSYLNNFSSGVLPTVNLTIKDIKISPIDDHLTYGISK